MTGARAAVIADCASSFRNLFVHDRAKCLGGHIRNVVRTNFSASLNSKRIRCARG
jgi:hypothetical protein